MSMLKLIRITNKLDNSNHSFSLYVTASSYGIFGSKNKGFFVGPFTGYHSSFGSFGGVL